VTPDTRCPQRRHDRSVDGRVAAGRRPPGWARVGVWETAAAPFRT